MPPQTANEKRLLQIAERIEGNNAGLREAFTSLQAKVETLTQAAKSPTAHEVEDLNDELAAIEGALKAQEQLANEFRGAASQARVGNENVVDVSGAVDATEATQGSLGLDNETNGKPGGQPIDATPAGDPNAPPTQTEQTGVTPLAQGQEGKIGGEASVTGVTPLASTQDAPSDAALGGDLDADKRGKPDKGRGQ